MWLVDAEPFAQRFQVTVKVALMFRCTSEHVVARQEGGRLTVDNIAAACVTCNTRRHRFRPFQAPSFERFRERVRARIKSGHWHPKEAKEIVSARTTGPSYRSDLMISMELVGQRAGISLREPRRRRYAG